MIKKVTVRDCQGRPIEATLIRRLKLKGFEKCKLALTRVSGQVTVTELSTGAQLAWVWERLNEPNAEKEAVRIAKDKLQELGMESFQAGVKATIKRFGGEVLNS